MLIKGVQFPDELLRAQSAGELVVFAGAGVSSPPPSSLPLFKQLAQEIGQHSPLRPESQEPDDHYLGRLKKDGVHVHDAAKRILLKDSSKPHDLHRLLLALAPTEAQVRIVGPQGDEGLLEFVQIHFFLVQIHLPAGFHGHVIGFARRVFLSFGCRGQI